MIELDVKTLQILWTLSRDAGHELLRCNTLGLGFEHDGCAMRIVRADKVHGMSGHTHRAHPDVRLDVLHDVADMKGAVGVGQRSRDKNGSGHE